MQRTCGILSRARFDIICFRRVTGKVLFYGVGVGIVMEMWEVRRKNGIRQ